MKITVSLDLQEFTLEDTEYLMKDDISFGVPENLAQLLLLDELMEFGVRARVENDETKYCLVYKLGRTIGFCKSEVADSIEEADCL